MYRLVRINQLTFLSFQLNGLVDSKKYNFSVKQIKSVLEEKEDIFGFIKENFDEVFDISVFSEQDKKDINKEFLDMSLAVDERKKFIIENDGLCLLIAYSLEMIQRLSR